jgi:hypothetical protein
MPYPLLRGYPAVYDVTTQADVPAFIELRVEKESDSLRPMAQTRL